MGDEGSVWFGTAEGQSSTAACSARVCFDLTSGALLCHYGLSRQSCYMFLLISSFPISRRHSRRQSTIVLGSLGSIYVHTHDFLIVRFHGIYVHTDEILIVILTMGSIVLVTHFRLEGHNLILECRSSDPLGVNSIGLNVCPKYCPKTCPRCQIAPKYTGYRLVCGAWDWNKFAL